MNNNIFPNNDKHTAYNSLHPDAEVVRVKVMQPNISIFTTTREAFMIKKIK